jgi:hypothetical protein
VENTRKRKGGRCERKRKMKEMGLNGYTIANRGK